MLPENPTLDEIETVFADDRFATQAAGCRVVSGERGRAVAEMEWANVHRNAMGNVMGGAIFTLADFAFAVAVNGHAERVTVSQHVSITFLSPARGTTLLAEARCVKAGRTTCLYTVDVTDDAGTHVAYATVNGFTVG